MFLWAKLIVLASETIFTEQDMEDIVMNLPGDIRFMYVLLGLIKLNDTAHPSKL